MPDSERTPWIELQTLRAKDAMTLKQLSEITGLSFQYLSQLEIGDRRPTPRAIAKIAEAINVPKSMLEPRAKAAAA